MKGKQFMKSWWAAVAVVAALGCGHAKSTERVNGSGSGKDSNGPDGGHASSREESKGSHDEPPHDESGVVLAGEHAHSKPESKLGQPLQNGSLIIAPSLC